MHKTIIKHRRILQKIKISNGRKNLQKTKKKKKKIIEIEYFRKTA